MLKGVEETKKSANADDRSPLIERKREKEGEQRVARLIGRYRGTRATRTSIADAISRWSIDRVAILQPRNDINSLIIGVKPCP